MKAGILIELKGHLKELKLSTVSRELEPSLRQAGEDGLGHDEFLLELTGKELESRADKRLKRRIREARFPLIKPLETFNLSVVPQLDIRLFRELAGCDFISEHRNVIFLGSSGTGKTHMATALGLEACKNNFRTRFVTCYPNFLRTIIKLLCNASI